MSSKIQIWFISFLLLNANIATICQAGKYNITKTDEHLILDGYFFDQNEQKQYLDKQEGTAILLVFWASWCGSCIANLPLLDNLQKDFRKLPFKIIAVSQDGRGADFISKYFQSNDIRHLEVFFDHNHKLFNEFSVVSMPTAFLINSEGKLKITFKGQIKWYNDEIRSMILHDIGWLGEKPKNTYKAPPLTRHISQTKIYSNPLENSKEQDNKKLTQQEEKADESKN